MVGLRNFTEIGAIEGRFTVPPLHPRDRSNTGTDFQIDLEINRLLQVVEQSQCRAVRCGLAAGDVDLTRKMRTLAASSDLFASNTIVRGLVDAYPLRTISFSSFPVGVAFARVDKYFYVSNHPNRAHHAQYLVRSHQ
jgi:hypothetical protein